MEFLPPVCSIATFESEEPVNDAAADGSEIVDVRGLDAVREPRQQVRCAITRADGSRETVQFLARLDTKLEVSYYRHGGIMNYVLRRRLARSLNRRSASQAAPAT